MCGLLNILIFMLIYPSVLLGHENESMINITRKVISEIDTSLISAPSIIKDNKRENFYRSLIPTCKCNKCFWREDDCCKDEKYCPERDRKMEEFSCVNIPLYGDVYMIDKCLSNYPHPKVVKKCYTTNQTELSRDFLLSLPVTTQRNITYRNVFCAVCNNEETFLIWNIASRIPNVVENNSISALTDPFKLEKPQTSSKRLVKANEIVSFLPSNWIQSLHHCKRNASNIKKDSFCDANNVTSKSESLELFNLTNSRLPKMRLDLYKRFIEWQPEKNVEIECISECILNRTYKIEEKIFFVNNETVFLEPSSMKFGPGEWRKTLDNKRIFVCGKNISISDVILPFNLYLFDVTLSILVIFSVCFLILFLIIMLRKKEKLGKLLDKIIFSICVTLLPLYLIDRIPIWQVPCTAITSVVSHYLYLSYHTWLAITAYDVWRAIYCRSVKFRNVSGKKHLKRYIIYCCIGWISPLSIIFISLYIDSLPSNVIPCEGKPNYGKTFSCFIENRIPLAYFYSYPSTVMFSIIIILFIHTAFYIYQTRNAVSSSARYYNQVLKLIVMMGVGWTFDVLWMYTQNIYIQLIYYVITGPMGVVIFFVIGFENSMISSIRGKFNAIVQRCKGITSSQECNVRMDEVK